MIINGKDLLAAAPIKSMLDKKETNGLVSHGLTEAGYDIRIKQAIWFYPAGATAYLPYTSQSEEEGVNNIGFKKRILKDPLIHIMDPEAGAYEVKENARFLLASSIEEFDMPNNLLGIVHDKSSWARRGLSVFNTCIEPGWKGYLTLELVFHGNETIYIPPGSGIAQVIFHDLANHADYRGKYQNQPNQPVRAK